MTTEKELDTSWDTETGLPNDIDAWIVNAKFGQKDEYAQAVAAAGTEGGALLLMFDLADEKGDVIGNQGYSVGSGWEASEDGKSISHPKRKNVVGSSLYGQLQNRVIKDLGLKEMMQGRGKPTDAKCWNGLGFHWMLEEHETVGGKPASGIMPTIFINDKGSSVATPAPAAPVAPPAAGTIEATLATLARTLDQKAFQEKALGLPSVAANDELMASVLDEGAEGFWTTHQA